VRCWTGPIRTLQRRRCDGAYPEGAVSETRHRIPPSSGQGPSSRGCHVRSPSTATSTPYGCRRAFGATKHWDALGHRFDGGEGLGLETIPKFFRLCLDPATCARSSAIGCVNASTALIVKLAQAGVLERGARTHPGPQPAGWCGFTILAAAYLHEVLYTWAATVNPPPEVRPPNP